jgi:adenylate cyclase
LDPDCKISIARHEYIVEYNPQALGAYGPPPADDDYMDELMKSSLMDRAGLSRRDDKKKFKNRKREEL